MIDRKALLSNLETLWRLAKENHLVTGDYWDVEEVQHVAQQDCGVTLSEETAMQVIESLNQGTAAAGTSVDQETLIDFINDTVREKKQ